MSISVTVLPMALLMDLPRLLLSAPPVVRCLLQQPASCPSSPPSLLRLVEAILHLPLTVVTICPALYLLLETPALLLRLAANPMLPLLLVPATLDFLLPFLPPLVVTLVFLPLPLVRTPVLLSLPLLVTLVPLLPPLLVTLLSFLPPPVVSSPSPKVLFLLVATLICPVLVLTVMAITATVLLLLPEPRLLPTPSLRLLLPPRASPPLLPVPPKYPLSLLLPVPVDVLSRSSLARFR
ncbi:hypothetical protein CFO_g3510 [Ceratocystis platani]|uniref:Uncharacterized protein n=1 Tax=Ceratocystis fimbriata f. sp. platani TaxID=88771 RepID=A0A0F8CTW7_CERFI|nr:hypothetical protein CFO_g3510 [Ceratocystis platani]